MNLSRVGVYAIVKRFNYSNSSKPKENEEQNIFDAPYCAVCQRVCIGPDR